ncbi:uncharacterized protein [Littorina saxatilis]|uniref:uncharacterized protein n=1 Tax=Littorina saxatilis TaxID=31220 RepID=UPI0038B5FF0B
MIVGLSVGLGLVALIAGAAFFQTRRPPGLDWDTEAKTRNKSLRQLQGLALAHDVEETGVGGVRDKDVRAKDVENKDVENKDVENKDVENKDVGDKDDDDKDDDD